MRTTAPRARSRSTASGRAVTAASRASPTPTPRAVGSRRGNVNLASPSLRSVSKRSICWTRPSRGRTFTRPSGSRLARWCSSVTPTWPKGDASSGGCGSMNSSTPCRCRGLSPSERRQLVNMMGLGPLRARPPAPVLSLGQTGNVGSGPVRGTLSGTSAAGHHSASAPTGVRWPFAPSLGGPVRKVPDLHVGRPPTKGASGKS